MNCCHDYIMLAWRSGGLPLKKFLERNCIKRPQPPLHDIGEMEVDINLKRKSSEFSVNGTSCPPAPPWKRAAAHPAPSSVVPNHWGDVKTSIRKWTEVNEIIHRGALIRDCVPFLQELESSLRAD